MNIVQPLNLSWRSQLTLVRLVLFSQATLVLICVARFVRSGRFLYRYPGKSIFIESVLRAQTEPGLLAAYAFARRLSSKAVDKREDPKLTKSLAHIDKVLRILNAAESKCLYLWETCHADVESARRASFLSFLLSVVMIAYAAFPTLNRYVLNKSARPLMAAEHLLLLFTLGCSSCTVLYLASSVFERELTKRKTTLEVFLLKSKG